MLMIASGKQAYGKDWGVGLAYCYPSMQERPKSIKIAGRMNDGNLAEYPTDLDLRIPCYFKCSIFHAAKNKM